MKGALEDVILPVHLQLGHAAGSTLQAMRAMWYRNGASNIISGAVYPGIPALQAIDSIQDEDWGAYQRTLHFSHSVNWLLIDQLISPWADRAAGQDACGKPTSFRCMQLLVNVGLSGHAAV